MIAVGLILLVWAAVVVAAWFVKPTVLQSDLIAKLPPLQGHRGYCQAGLQENTLASISASKSQGLKMCELDVRLTRDNQVILFHDENTQRILGRDLKVADSSLQELRALGDVATLQEVLESSHTPEFINIEIKSGNIQCANLVRQILKVIELYGAQKQILISSFNPFVLRQVAQQAKRPLLRALLVTEVDEPGNRMLLKKMWLMRWSRCHMLNLDQKMINQGRMLYWRNLNIPIAAWTVNDAQKARQLIAMGVVSVITDQLVMLDLNG